MRKNPDYHLALWTANAGFFLVLDFFKRIDDLLSGLNPAQLAVNIGIVLLACTPLCLLMGVLSALLERLAGWRAVHSLALFALITTNLWSLKVGLAPWLEGLRPGVRQILAVLMLLAATLGSVRLGTRMAGPGERWQRKSRPVLAGWLLLTVLGLAATPWATPLPQGTPSDRPNVVLITMDALGAKSMSLYGYARQTTPNLERLAEQSIVLERLHANFNVTGLALPSLNGYLSWTPAGPTLAQCLQEAGYNTAFFSFWAPHDFFLRGFSHFELTRSAMLSPGYRWLRTLFQEPQLRWLAGLSSEELSYFNPYLSQYHDDIFWRTEHYPPQPSLQAALDYLQDNPRGAFVWVHLWPPHFPYLPDPDVANMFGPGPAQMKPWINATYEEDQDAYVASLRNLYDASVYSVDRQVGRFLDQLKEKGLFEQSYVIVSGDHGESFERGWVGHSGWPLMEVITHVPMVISTPDPPPGGQVRVQTLAQQLDFAPTLLELLGLPIPPTMQGESLQPYFLQPDRLSERYKISVSLSASRGQGGQLAVYWKTFKLMFLSNDHKVFRLYDLFADPQATVDISAQHPELVQEMMKRLALPSAGTAP
jgi:arylsulfatase A-like enzyme